MTLKHRRGLSSTSTSSKFPPAAEPRPSKRAKTSGTHQANPVSDAAAANADKAPTMPCRDPSPAPQHSSITGPSASSSHATVVHEGGDQEEPDRQTEDQHHPSTPPVGPDDELTEGYESASSLSDVTPSAYNHTIENGRRYQHFKNGRYPIPNDDEEHERENLKHSMVLEVCGWRLYHAPIRNPHIILDIGTGSGVWAIDMGYEFPNACVRGIDLSPHMPCLVPPNVEFIVDDCEQEWLEEGVDFVHFRFMVIVLKDVPGVLRYAYQSLKPGGWVELQELCAEVLCDDGTMANNDPVKYMYECVQRAFLKFGMDVTLPKRLEPMLRDAGFENIQYVVKKVPIGPWDSDNRRVGKRQRKVVRDLMPAFSGRPFNALGLSQVESEVILAHARLGLGETGVHRYFHYYFWYAQKPLE